MLNVLVEEPTPRRFSFTALALALVVGGIAGYVVRSVTSEKTNQSADPDPVRPSTDRSPGRSLSPLETTPSAVQSSEPQTESEEGLTFANPIPFHKTVEISSNWKIRVVSTVPDGTALVLHENQFNESPRPGYQFFIARVAVTYTGKRTGNVFGDLDLNAIDTSAVVYESLGKASCGVIPDDITDAGEVFPGGTVKGNTCWSVRSKQSRSLQLLVQESFRDSTRRFLALR